MLSLPSSSLSTQPDPTQSGIFNSAQNNNPQYDELIKKYEDALHTSAALKQTIKTTLDNIKTQNQLKKLHDQQF